MVSVVDPVLSLIEICAGAGGQSLGLEHAGFGHTALVENDPWACRTLRKNRPEWNVMERDVRTVNWVDEGLTETFCDLLAGGVPCPPFSAAGNQLGADDERDLFPTFLNAVETIRPGTVMIENVRGLLSPKFAAYRQIVEDRLTDLGYVSAGYRLLHASDFGVPQLRPRVVLVASIPDVAARFVWPTPTGTMTTVGETLLPLMASAGWEGATLWANQAGRVAPTLVGGSKKHGGADLGPTRARAAWSTLGINGSSLADTPPPAGFVGAPRLTVEMAALIQGFPPEWVFEGRKTARYRQIGNAFPPPVASAVGISIRKAISNNV